VISLDTVVLTPFTLNCIDFDVLNQYILGAMKRDSVDISVASVPVHRYFPEISLPRGEVGNEANRESVSV